jgi:hypothetical protein
MQLWPRQSNRLIAPCALQSLAPPILPSWTGLACLPHPTWVELMTPTKWGRHWEAVAQLGSTQFRTTFLSGHLCSSSSSSSNSWSEAAAGVPWAGSPT